MTSSRKLATLFLAVVVPSAVTLVWFGVELLQQDRSLWSQRELESRQAAARSISQFLEQSLGEAERSVSGDALPKGAVRFTVTALGVRPFPAGHVLWLPVPPAMPAVDSRQFAEAEILEFQGAADEALPVYESLAKSSVPATRAGALLRVARIYRRQQEWDQALTAYRTLAAIRDVAIEGMPADLLARRASCSVLEEADRQGDLGREASALAADFAAGSWMLDRPAWELTAGEIAQWTGRVLPFSEDRQAFSVAADWLWAEWRQNQERRPPASGRRLVVLEDAPVILEENTFGKRMGAGTVALALLPSVSPGWMQKAMRAAPASGDQLSLVTESGQLLAGPKPPSGPGVMQRSASETGLPWTLVFSPGDPSRQAQEFVVITPPSFLGACGDPPPALAGGSYLLWRVIQRELAVARLQTDFVAAVFRNANSARPLTSLRHVTELLEEDDELPRERRRSFYEALGRNTERLHRLVESLLDFARMEGGRKPYDLRPVDAGDLAAQVVADFRKEAGPRGFTVDLDVEDASALLLNADTESLTHALWNLLDNAVKYSPEAHTVLVSVRRHSEGVAFSVRDRGLGIPRHERKEIFRRFVRGEKARELGIKGTGLGLAMVSHIVDAHGGAIELESQEGVGSTFRMVLPVCG